MILIGEQILNRLKTAITFPKLSVKDFYSVSKVAAPLITVNEIPGAGVLFPDGQPKIVRNSFQFEIYGKAQTVNGTPMTAIAIAQSLMLQMDEILNKEFGLTQVGDVSFAPYASDQTIMRGVTRYRGDIDTRTEIIYR